jgi:hypothetical protein
MKTFTCKHTFNCKLFFIIILIGTSLCVLLTARLKRRILTQKELKAIKDVTPTLHKGSTQLFRQLRDKGMLSFILLQVLLVVLNADPRVVI